MDAVFLAPISRDTKRARSKEDGGSLHPPQRQGACSLPLRVGLQDRRTCGNENQGCGLRQVWRPSIRERQDRTEKDSRDCVHASLGFLDRLSPAEIKLRCGSVDKLW